MATSLNNRRLDRTLKATAIQVLLEASNSCQCAKYAAGQLRLKNQKSIGEERLTVQSIGPPTLEPLSTAINSIDELTTLVKI